MQHEPLIRHQEQQVDLAHLAESRAFLVILQQVQAFVPSPNPCGRCCYQQSGKVEAATTEVVYYELLRCHTLMAVAEGTWKASESMTWT